MTMTRKKKTTGELLSHEDLKVQFEEFIDLTIDARKDSERCRDYYDGRQWSAEQIAELKRRKQAPIVNNRIKVKQNGLLGLTSMRKGNPQAFPRNADADSKAAEATTDGLRYASDKTELDDVYVDAADSFFCEGYCGCYVTVEQNGQEDIDVLVENIPWDRLFFDPYSRKHNFSDARYKGFVLWMDEDDIIDQFPDAPEEATHTSEELQKDDWLFEDKPTWLVRDGSRVRHLVATHYFKHHGVWHVAIYTGGGFLMKPQPSPYLDEHGEPDCPIEMEHAYINREGGRYGELLSFLDIQDEINHRRSKALFLLSQRQTFGNRGAVTDIRKAKRELAKPDGHLEVGQGEFGKDFGLLPTGDMAQGQMDLLNDAKAEMDAQSYNAQMAGDRMSGDLSGKAIGKLQAAGVIELNRLFDRFSNFKLRVYRQMWSRIRQYWDQEKWVRVTDDDQKPRYVGFNVPVTMKEALQDIMDDDTKPREMRVGASAQMIMLEQQNPQGLEQVIEVQNRPAELDMDLILNESYDFLNTSDEQLTAILQFGAQSNFDILDLLEISNVHGKEQLIEKLTQRRKEQAEAAAQSGPDANSMFMMSQADKGKAETAKKLEEAKQINLENKIMESQTMIPYKGSITI